MDGVRVTSPFLDLAIGMSESIPAGISSQPGSLLFYFCQLILLVSLLVFLLVSTAVGDKNYQLQLVMGTTAFPEKAGVIDLLASTLVWISSYTTYL